jgi:hypothetical protein
MEATLGRESTHIDAEGHTVFFEKKFGAGGNAEVAQPLVWIVRSVTDKAHEPIARRAS